LKWGTVGAWGMQDCCVGSIGDFGKLALLRHLMGGRRLAICWYTTAQRAALDNHDRYFAYLDRPDEFRHFAPEIYDALKAIVCGASTGPRRIAALEASGLLDGAVFHDVAVPKRAPLRKPWAADLVRSIDEADFVFFDPDNGIQGKRLTPKHVALSEIAALRRPQRMIMLGQRHSGRHSEPRYLADCMRSLGCRRIELIRIRLVASRFYIVADHDAAVSEQIEAFSRKWGNWVSTYLF
jgi:hypothetical protein